MSECSSGDSTGVKPDDQKVLYDEVIKKRPSTILSLEHEVYGMFLFAFFSPSYQVNFLTEYLFHVVFRYQRVILFSVFFLVVVV